MQLTLRNFLKEQCANVPPVPRDDLTGRTVIVLGANTGIGFDAAKHFASMKPGKLILACRDEQRANDALQKIKQETGCPNVEVSIVDLESFASVNAFVERFEKLEKRLDILVANAAVVHTTLKTTDDGWESSFQVNVLSTCLLCLLLLPTMSQTSQQDDVFPRIVVVTSELHYLAKLNPKVLESNNPVRILGKPEHITQRDINNRYFDTKTLNILFVRALDARLKRQSIIANAVNPGLCATTIRKDFTGLRRFVVEKIIVKLLARTAEEGSRQLVWASLGSTENPNTLRGAYISSMEVYEPSDFIVGEEGSSFQNRFWDAMIQELGAVNPKIHNIATSYLGVPSS